MDKQDSGNLERRDSCPPTSAESSSQNLRGKVITKRTLSLCDAGQVYFPFYSGILGFLKRAMTWL